MIEPFKIEISDERLADIRDRVARYDWSNLPDLGGWRSGVGKKDLRRLSDYWLTRFDWRAVEQRLNRLPHFITEIDGTCIHFIHARGDGSKPPILLLHGWPGSFLEFEAFIEPLTSDGHDVVVPSLPGFAFSRANVAVGPRRAGQLFALLMDALFGPQRFIVHGGDWGAHIASWMTFGQPDRLLGAHINMAYIHASDAAPTTPDEIAFATRCSEIFEWELGYNLEQETKPQTLGAVLADSPVGVAAWILEKFGVWADLPKLSNGDPDVWSKFSEEFLLSNIMLYIGPSAVVTATWIYHGKRLERAGSFSAGTQIEVPLGVAAFPDPVFAPPPRSFLEKTYNVVHWTDMPSGGHFASLEEPRLMLSDIREFVGKIF